jgi:hypothetical protein
VRQLEIFLLAKRGDREGDFGRGACWLGLPIFSAEGIASDPRPELIAPPHLTQNPQERIALPRRPQQSPPSITTERNEVQLPLTIPPFQLVTHHVRHSCAPSPAACPPQAGSQDESRCGAIQKTCTKPARRNRYRF